MRYTELIEIMHKFRNKQITRTEMIIAFYLYQLHSRDSQWVKIIKRQKQD